jgi:hypothetical protein
VKFKSQIITQASGSIGGTTFSHNRGGMYMRSRATPTNPNSPQQQAVRTAVASLVSTWNNVLTAPQRAVWDAYAENTPVLNKLGEPINVGGLAMYIRANVPALQASLTRIDDGPTTFNTGEYTEPVIGTISEAGQTMSLAFTAADDWASEDGAAMLVLASRGQNASINYFKGPYRYAGKVEGDSGTPPTSPASIALPFAVVEGQKVFFQVRVIRADGRLSAPFRGVGTCAA